MFNQAQLIIERKNDLLPRLGISRSTLNNRINDGLWCPPISLGDRAVGFLKHETDALIGAHANDYSREQIKELVKHLIDKRKGLLSQPKTVSTLESSQSIQA